jgi:hypothetical protein
LFGRVSEFGDKAGNLCLQRRQIIFDYVPDEHDVHAPIAMNKAIPESDNLFHGASESPRVGIESLPAA